MPNFGGTEPNILFHMPDHGQLIFSTTDTVSYWRPIEYKVPICISAPDRNSFSAHRIQLFVDYFSKNDDTHIR